MADGHEHVVEDRLRCASIEEARDCAMPATVVTRAWTDDLSRQFYDVYVQSFRDRPGFPGWPQERWQSFFTGYDTFRADMSMLACDGDEPVAYLLAAIDPDEDDPSRSIGWVVQMGVVPTHRRTGIAAALLEQFRQAACAAGCDALCLHVNVNNPEARALYEKFGFSFDHRRSGG